MQADGRKDMRKLTGAFCDYANARKMTANFNFLRDIKLSILFYLYGSMYVQYTSQIVTQTSLNLFYRNSFKRNCGGKACRRAGVTSLRILFCVHSVGIINVIRFIKLCTGVKMLKESK
jgi:hypothetical protein